MDGSSDGSTDPIGSAHGSIDDDGLGLGVAQPGPPTIAPHDLPYGV